MSCKRKLNCFLSILIIISLCIVFNKDINARGKLFVDEKMKVIATDTKPYKVISKGSVAGEYQAVPDACRLKNSDIVVVFYAGNNHVTFPDEKYLKAGRICLVRSKDEGRTWSNPVVIYDDINDNRDPHINQMSDGSLILSFFSLEFEASVSQKLISNEPSYSNEQITKFSNNPDLLHEQQPENFEKKVRPTGSREWTTIGPYILRSNDNGKTWENEAKLITTYTQGWNCSAKVRELPDGTWLLPVYHSESSLSEAWGGVIASYNEGKTWEKEVSIGKEAKLVLAAETDIILLNNKILFAALRGDRSIVNMHNATSSDFGKTWSPVEDMGFVGHAPSFTRLKTGEILLSFLFFCWVLILFLGVRWTRCALV